MSPAASTASEVGASTAVPVACPGIVVVVVPLPATWWTMPDSVYCVHEVAAGVGDVEDAVEVRR